MIFDSKKDILNEIKKECEENLMLNTPYTLDYVLDSSLTSEDKHDHTTTEYVKIWCENIGYDNGEYKTKNIDITGLIAQLMDVDCMAVMNMNDNHKDLYYPIQHKDNAKLKDVCADLNKKIVKTSEENGMQNLFYTGCTVLYRA